MSELYERGVEIFSQVHGEEMAEGLRAYVEKGEGFGYLQAKWSMEWAFGELWSREGLERKLRSCAVLGMVIGMGQANEIKYHTKMGMANGLSVKEIEEIFYSSIPYCGFPLANTAKAAMEEAFAELADVAGKT